MLEGRPIYTLKGHVAGTSVTSITFSSNGEFFASGGGDRQLLMWKTNFDKDDIARKIPRQLVSPITESSFSINDEISQKIDIFEGKEETVEIVIIMFYIIISNCLYLFITILHYFSHYMKSMII